MTLRTGQEISRANLRAAISSWTPGIKPTWTIAEVRHALRMHREGVFSYSAQLIDTFGEDDQIPHLTEKLSDAVFQNDFELQPVDDPRPALSKRIAKEFGPRWWDYFPETEVDDFFRWYKMAGVGLAVLDWDRRPSHWGARLRTLPLHFLRRDEHLGKWFYQAREGELEVTPGDGRWLLITDGQRGWMKALVRQLAIPWVSKHLTLRDWNRYNERHGLPIIKAMAPAIADEGDKDQFWEDMEDLRSEAVAQLPTHLDDNGAAFDLDLLEAKDQSWKSFEAHVNRTDRKFTLIFTGGNLNTEVSTTGSNRAASENHDEQLSNKASAAEKRLSTELRRQGLWPIVAMNVAAATFEVTPWPHWDTSVPEDLNEKATGQKTFGEALGFIEKAGYDVENIDELSEKHGLVLKKREEAAPAPPAGVAAPSAPNEGEGQARSGRKAFALASGAAMNQNPGFVEGQVFADALADRSTEHAKAAMQPTLQAIMEELDAATGYEDLRERLVARYGQMDADGLAQLVRDTMVLADLNGRYSVNQDA